MTSWRMVAGAAAASALVMVGLAQPAEASGPTKGFTPVRSSAEARTSITAVGGGEVWVAGSAANGQVRLEHRTARGWTTSQLPVTASETLQIHGSGPRDVWLVSSDQLWHYTGAWRRVALPGSEVATAVFDVPGANVYVGTYHPAVSDLGYNDVVARLFRFDGRRWTATGGPELPDAWNETGTKTIKSVKVAHGQVYATVLWRPPSAVVINDTYRVSGTTWTPVTRTFMRSGGGVTQLGGWLSYRDGTQVFLGTSDMMSGPSTLLCRQVTSTSTDACPLPSGGVSAGVLPDRGPAVLGGQDWNAWENNTVVRKQGRFLLRERNGSERVIAGDPGDTTVAMALDPAGSEVWAITKAGETSSVQRYRR